MSGDTSRFRQPLMLYKNLQGKKFADARGGLVRGAEREIVGRGLATGDYDNDGRIDAVAIDAEGAPLLLHNVAQKRGHWLRLKLEGTRCNRDGYGALVTATLPGGRKLVRHCQSDGSYLSASDKRVWLGLDDAVRADISVHWPDGADQRVGILEADRTVTVREPG